jgi:methylmalonyl-CoA mutase cobalamin-binding subunit
MIHMRPNATTPAKRDGIMPHDDHRFSTAHGVSAFGTLAMEVVSVLNARQAAVQVNQARPYIRSILDRRLMTKAYFNPSDALSELRALRLSDAAIIDNYIPEAARSIGQKWAQDELGFADVTIASVRLQSLLTEVEFLNPDDHLPAERTLDILIVACEGEQHTLGCFVAAAQLRRRGATVETMCGQPEDVIRSRILRNDYDAILFSCSRRRHLETISGIVIDIRSRMSEPPLFAIGGIILSKTRGIKRLTGADLVTSDVDVVVEQCEQRPKPVPKWDPR